MGTDLPFLCASIQTFEPKEQSKDILSKRSISCVTFTFALSNLYVRFREDESAEQSQLECKGEAGCSCWAGRETYQVIMSKADQT